MQIQVKPSGIAVPSSDCNKTHALACSTLLKLTASNQILAAQPDSPKLHQLTLLTWSSYHSTARKHHNRMHIPRQQPSQILLGLRDRARSHNLLSKDAESHFCWLSNLFVNPPLSVILHWWLVTKWGAHCQVQQARQISWMLQLQQRRTKLDHTSKILSHQTRDKYQGNSGKRGQTFRPAVSRMRPSGAYVVPVTLYSAVTGPRWAERTTQTYPCPPKVTSKLLM